MILTHESGSQEDQFDEKKWRQKISWDYPFKLLFRTVYHAAFDILKGGALLFYLLHWEIVVVTL
jgi:hypothetical protein